MQKILITGGAGYIGSQLATDLVLKKYKVTVIDNFQYDKNSLNHLMFYKNFDLINKSILDLNLLKNIVKKNDLIIPLAALVGAPLCDKNKKLAKLLNLNTIKYIKKIISKNQRIIYTTTNSGYGTGSKNTYCDENSPLNPISYYGVTKNLAEKVIMEHDNSIAYRLATVFGYSYRMRTDLLVNNFVYKAYFAKNLDIFEPQFRRNFIHIKDVVKGINFAIENFIKLKGNVYNLGLSSANITKIELANKIKKYLPSLKIKISKNQKDPDQRDYYVSNKKIEKQGFKAKISLDQGIQELIRVYRFSNNKFFNNY
jgi:nucleoside-diphosphate-sugar epimerase